MSNQPVAGGCLIHPRRLCVSILETLSTMRSTRIQCLYSRAALEHNMSKSLLRLY